MLAQVQGIGARRPTEGSRLASASTSIRGRSPLPSRPKPAGRTIRPITRPPTWPSRLKTTRTAYSPPRIRESPPTPARPSILMPGGARPPPPLRGRIILRSASIVSHDCIGVRLCLGCATPRVVIADRPDPVFVLRAVTRRLPLVDLFANSRNSIDTGAMALGLRQAPNDRVRWLDRIGTRVQDGDSSGDTGRPVRIRVTSALATGPPGARRR